MHRIAAGSAGETAFDGEALYQKACAACHGVGPVEAPKFGDHAAWAELIAEGQAVVTAHGWVGVREMPPRGGVPDLSLEAFGRAVAYMARAAGADWQDPELSASLLQAIRAEEKARRQALQAQAHTVADQGRSGAAVYEAICRHCHETGVAGAPAKGMAKRGDRCCGKGRPLSRRMPGWGCGRCPRVAGMTICRWKNSPGPLPTWPKLRGRLA